MDKKHSKLIKSNRTKGKSILLFLLLSAQFFTSASEESFSCAIEKMDTIDEIVAQSIADKEFPGCQVLVMKNKETVFQKAYGFLTYDSLQEVTNETIYDLASITKVAATTYMLMSLYEERRIKLDDPIVCYLPEYLGSNKEKITIRELLSHNGKLRSYLPFWENTLTDDYLDPTCDPIPMNAYGLQPNPAMRDSLNSWIISSELGKFRGRSKYRYSDIGFMILHQVAESAAGVSMEAYLTEKFYQPEGLNRLMFNPIRKGIAFDEVAPTEYDFLLRFSQVWGEVHDRNAAILGGVSGHAGLFSNSQDLGQLMNLMLEKGHFQYETIQEFTSPHFNHNRRGLGWDRKNPGVAEAVSDDSFGHKGFTGTMIWVDPEEELIFVFLSNRVYPNAENRKLITNRTRKRIQSVVYEALEANS